MVSLENKRIFIWKDFGEWKPVLEDMYKEILTPDLKGKIRQNKALVDDCEHPGAFEELSGHSIYSIITDDKIKEFRQHYSHIRVYHGCRPTDSQSYYEKGILPSIDQKNVQVGRFREIYLNGRFSELTEDMLRQSIKKVGPKDDDLCLVIDDRFIIKRCGHYLIYGSEYLFDLASQLPIEDEDIERFRSELRKIGKPTLIEINLPNTTEYVSDGKILELYGDMLTGWLYNIAHLRTESNRLDFTFELDETLPSKYIHSHYHPKRIPDQEMGWKIYNAETGEYEDSET